MAKNVILAGVGGFVFALALAGLAFLMFGKGDVSSQPVALGPQMAVQPNAVQPLNPGISARKVDPRKVRAAKTGPVHQPESASDLRAELERILREYDEVVLHGRTSNTSAAERIQSLRERSARIDALVAELAALGDEAVAAMLEVLSGDIASNRTDRQSFLVRGLAQMASPKAIAALGEALSMATSWGLKMTVVAQLAQHGGDVGYQLLADRIVGEPDARVRAAMLKFIGRKQTREAAELAARLARSDPDPNVRIAASRALGESGDVFVAGPVLEEIARTADNLAVRQNAVQTYARMMGEQGILVLEDLVRNDANVRIKVVVLLSLQEIGGDRVKQVLTATAEDPGQSADVQARARSALAALERRARAPDASGVGGGVAGSGERIQGLKPMKLEGLKPIGAPGNK